ncbi:beta-ketoacyl-ACP synthase III [Aquisalinus flavus]|uniref:Beta-ketoacyl-[acyl-carrier-protein] synthase III n=1 Tax=Aquisalinus flavus TaxID=1526572 RepID=A0A8J2V2P4_9PROT|nr:beta-ketoacyl-ACP synthase III [Aquisalinus flavus]MBD0427699.1 ketoacyl-ACP synthase III [Aquisalinus flavus]UNE47478.1 ketoacyl-ACP synthase III [Aquisalinus flavus]GGD03116.1 3-oxoacyl-[acyl-carrier-protein] synthase 3 [Aquisalinus flavus]
MSLKAVVEGVGGYLPDRVVTNDELAARVDTSDEWITERTGIRQRHVAAEGQRTSDLATEAGRRAMDHAGVGPDDIDLVIIATATPDLTFPATAAITQAKLGITAGAAFDIQAVCTGFVYALSIAEKFLVSGQHKRALVIGAETFSRILDWEDRGTCVLFGDGAGAFVVSAMDEDEANGRGILSSYLRCDGRLTELLYVDGGVSATGTIGHLRMQGNKVFKEAVNKISEAMEGAAAAAGIDPTTVDWFVPHQANQRIINGVAKKLDLRDDQVISTIAMHGNTSAASIPLAFNEAVKDGKFKRGDLIMLEGMGGGLTWGAALLRY